MKVLITGCSDFFYWYKDKIGEVFEVKPEKDRCGDFDVKGDSASILPKDCHVIQSGILTKKKQTMKVLITGCSNEDYWYDKEIGNIHKVFPEKNNNGDFEMVNDREFAIDPQDCHVIQSVATVLTEWEKSGGELQLWGKNSKSWNKIKDEHRLLYCLNNILRIKPVETPQYRPYTFEEAKEVFTKQAWVIDKQTEELVMVFRVREDGVFLASYPKTEYDLLLSNFNHLDGTPCGVKIN